MGLLHLQDRLLAQEDEQLPLAGHVPGPFQKFHFVEWFFAAGDLMRTKKVIVCHPEGYTVAGTVSCTVTTGNTVRLLKGAVESFDKLFERTEFFGYLIVIGQADHLGDKDIPVFLQLELLCSQGIDAVAIGNELQGFAGKFLKFVKAMRMVRMQGPTFLEVET